MWAPHVYVSLFPLLYVTLCAKKFPKPLLGLQAYHCPYLWSGGLKEGHREVPNPKWKMTSTKMEDDLTQNGRRLHLSATILCLLVQHFAHTQLATVLAIPTLKPVTHVFRSEILNWKQHLKLNQNVRCCYVPQADNWKWWWSSPHYWYYCDERKFKKSCL